MKYPKVQTLYKRDESRNFVIMPGHLSKPEFDLIKYWEVSEKIDGTNIRIEYEHIGTSPGSTISDYQLTFHGRTDKADIPKYLLESLEKTFTLMKMAKVFPDTKKVILFGEGYGPKIQAAGKNYSKDEHSFVLFDVWIGGWWLERDGVAEIANKLAVNVVPSFGIMTTDEIVDFVKRQPKSVYAKNDAVMEGVVVRSAPLVLFRDGKPVMFKLKCSDFVKLEKEMNRGGKENGR